MFRFSVLIVALAGTLWSASGVANPETGTSKLLELDLDALLEVKLASGRWQPLNKAPGVTTVITARDIAAMGARDLSEVLETVPGLHVSPGIVGNPRYFIRGITSTYNPQTLVLIDGVPVNGIYLGYRNGFWAGMPVQAISRIEVMRSPASALYGADAVAGVINIVTKTEELQDERVSFGAGSYGTKSAAFQAGDKTAHGGFGLSLEWLKTDGPDEPIHADAQTAWDQLAKLLGIPVPVVSRAPGAQNYQRDVLEFRSYFQHENFSVKLGVQDRDKLGTGMGIAEALQPSGLFGSRRYLLQARYTDWAIAEHWLAEVEGSFYQQDQRPLTRVVIFPAGAFLGAFPQGFIGEPYYKEVTRRLDSKLRYEGGQNQRWLFGAGVVHAGLPVIRERKNFNAAFQPYPEGLVDVSDTPEVFMPEASRRQHYVLLQHEWAFASDWELTLGLRQDAYNDVGNTTNPRAALVWSASGDWTFKLLHGEAFRAPGFFELYSKNNPTSIGNPHLQPETIATTEWVADWISASNWRWNLSLFRYSAENFISVDPKDAVTRNRGRREGHGAEMEAQYRSAQGWRWLAHASWQRSEDPDTGSSPGFAPEHEIWQRLEWPLHDALFMSLQWNHVGERSREAGDPRPALKGYDAVDLSVSWQPPGTDASLNLRVSNLLDADIREPSAGPAGPFGFINLPGDIPMPKRNAMLELDWRY